MVFCISVYTSNHQSETRRKRKGLFFAIGFVFKACYLFGNDQFLPGPKIRRKSFSHLLAVRKHKWSDQNQITYLRLSRDQQELYPHQSQNLLCSFMIIAMETRCLQMSEKLKRLDFCLKKKAPKLTFLN